MGQLWTPPALCATASASLLGGGGGGGAFGVGGRGALVNVTWALAGPVLVYAGAGGASGAPSTSWGQGGNTCAGGGGGASAITVGGALLAIAGGGGGGGTNGLNGGASTGCAFSGDAGTPNAPTLATTTCSGGGGATQTTAGLVSVFTSFRAMITPSGTGPATSPGSNTGGNGANYQGGGVPPYSSNQSVGFSPGGAAGCFNPPTSYPNYRGGGGGGGGYYGGGGGGCSSAISYVGSPGGGGSSWASGSATGVAFAPGQPGGAASAAGADGSVSLWCATFLSPAASSSPTSTLSLGATPSRTASTTLTISPTPSITPTPMPTPPAPPTGVLYNVPISLLTGAGCTPCTGFPAAYSTVTPNLAACGGPYVFIGARFSTAYACMSIGAIDARSVVLGATPLNTPTLSRGVYYYNTAGSSIGFSGSPTIAQASCDTAAALPDTRMCWHTSSGGYRAGQCTSTGSTWQKELYNCPAMPAFLGNFSTSSTLTCGTPPNCNLPCSPGQGNTGGACAPCAAGRYLPSYNYFSAPCLLCPSGHFSSAPGAANCTQCAPGSHAPAPGASTCAPCPGGHFCPAGTASWARLNCGRGNFCPLSSAAPTPCPLQVPPAGGWGAQGVQGPAFLVETASCLNHCFWNNSAGADGGLLSRC